MHFYRANINKTLELLRGLKNGFSENVGSAEYFPCEYKKGSDLPIGDPSFMPFDSSSDFGGKDKHYWLHFTFSTQKSEGKYEGHTPFLVIRTSNVGAWDALNPQCLLYLSGELVQGMDINHTEYQIESGKEYEAYVYFYTGMNDCMKYDFNCVVNYVNTVVEKLYYDIFVPFSAAICFPEHDEKFIKIIKHLGAAVNLLDLRNIESREFYNSINEAEEYLEKEFYNKVCGKDNLVNAVVSCIGHTHIDVAWLWTYAQTKEKVQRSFSTVLALMERYPEYKFMSSQPQLYKYLKEEAPEVYERVKQRVKEGRWEVEGAMWVEADCNLISGESFVRQLLHGKGFIKDEFGVDSKILWLPDVFGYSAALPQILKKSGVDKFVTSKISWNETNMMPYDTFMWQGIDGTEIFTYFITAQDTRNNNPSRNTTYVGYIRPNQVLGTWERYQQKEYNNETMITYGFGDGGGGPTRDMLEQQRRIEKGLPGIPTTKMSTASEFLDRVEKRFFKNAKLLRQMPKWVGELYLEYHRGTYTNAAKNKKFNRCSEFLYQRAEALSAFDMVLTGGKYPYEKLNQGWETILLNQFHDVIPGSSIKEVYEDTDILYKNLIDKAEEIEKEKLVSLSKTITSSRGVLVYNPNGFEASGAIEFSGRKYWVKNIPPFGWKIINPALSEQKVKATNKTAENDYYKLTLDKNCNISSLYDKRAKREVFKKGEANQFRLYEDRPYQHDAWELSPYYKHKRYDINEPGTVESYNDEVSGGFIIKRKFSNSEITQKIALYNDSERIDFNTEVDWHEDHVILKVAFPFNVHAGKATYEIQFGNIERPTHANTSWDAAKFEVCGHKWMDVSDSGYGVSLMNDCKYGYGAEGSDITMSLLKSATYPNPESDRGHHSFTYSLLPHTGSFREAGTIKQAYMINNPLKYMEVGENKGIMPSEYSMVSSDKENVVIETVKKAEKSQDIIVRMYEAHNLTDTVNVKFGFDVKEIYECDLMENNIKKLPVKNNSVTLSVSNFEIVTLKVIR
ncbi:MAG: alpha-mannosidase [Bacillota bacterium]|nr:alpha-mannosidase [Bacillota bacterium]